MNRLIGHDGYRNCIDLLVENDNLASAILIEGASGIGKTQAALYAATRILGLKDCGDGDISKRVMEKMHPDLTVISENLDVIKKERMEELIKTQHLKSFEGGNRVCIIDGFDKVTVQGQNAVLKTLEEPPSYLYIILTTDNPERILSTIRSRCRIFSLFPLEEKRIEGFLELCGIKNAKAVAGLSNGSIGNAIKISENEDYIERLTTVKNIVSNLISGDEYAAYSSADFFEREKENIDQVLDMFSLCLRDLAVGFASGEKSLMKLGGDFYGLLDSIDFDRIIFCIREIERTKQKIRSNANYLLSIELLLLNIQGVATFGKRSRS